MSSISHKRQNKNKSKANKAIAMELVRHADTQENPFAGLTAFHMFKRNRFEARIECCRVTQLEKQCFSWAFDLLKRNMKTLYENSVTGWNEKDKQEEMAHSAAWYLIAYSAEQPVAFSHFRFDLDYGHPVVYCYELQLEEDCRRKGLGRFLLQILELMAFRNNLEKVVLTVFTHNPDAVKFFKSVGYTVDETSPISTIEECFDYEILSKHNPRFKQTSDP
nr:EOG090X0MNC [Ilyocryptus agilis]